MNNPLYSFLDTCKKPAGAFGGFLTDVMNVTHGPLVNWVLDHATIEDGDTILDVGCGGGANLIRMAKRYPSSRLGGIDHSETCIKKSRKAVEKLSSRCRIRQGNVEELPIRDELFDKVTAFETIYFWNDPAKGLSEIYRVLKSEGRIILAVEMTDPEKFKKLTADYEDMKIYTADELKKLVHDAGFRYVRVERKNEWAFIEGLKV